MTQPECENLDQQEAAEGRDEAVREVDVSPEEELGRTPEEVKGDSPRDQNESSQDATEAQTEGKAEESDEAYREKYLRLLAENENQMRRLRKESRHSTQIAISKVILDLLQPLDYFESALYHAKVSPSEDVQNWALGFKMIHKQFKEWLSSQGVHSFVSRGENFSPALHEAVEMVEDSNYREGTVIKELAKGYKMHDQILRAAKVVVAKAPQRSAEASEVDSIESASPETPQTSESEKSKELNIE